MKPSAQLRVLLTGASGAMGSETLKLLCQEPSLDVTTFALDSPKDRKILQTIASQVAPAHKFRTIWGDITNYTQTKAAVENQDLILHLAALVSPAADLAPALAMKINHGGTKNLLEAIRDTDQTRRTHFVNIGTVAETGDRLPPIHWGRVGDPIKPSYFDYYAVSKVAAERAVIEEGPTHWVSLRQTGLMGPAMTRIFAPIILHNPFNNVLEYVSDRDSARLLRNLCVRLAAGTLPASFWGHIYNIGGGEACRADTLTLYEGVFARLGLPNLDGAIDPRWVATRNFHGQYYLDSDKLETILPFRQDTLRYFTETYEHSLGLSAKAGRTISHLPGGITLLKRIIRQRFKSLAKAPLGTLHALNACNAFNAFNASSKSRARNANTGDARTNVPHSSDAIAAFWGSYQQWQQIPKTLAEFIEKTKEERRFDQVIPIDHGYDETKPETQLTLADISGAAKFRGGICLSDKMETGNWQSKLSFRCAFGHNFEASPRLILEGGHWCPTCENQSWNYHARALVDPFFAQVWNPLHSADEPSLLVEKTVSPEDNQ